MRVVVVRQPDEDVLLVGQEMQAAPVERNLGLTVTCCHVRFAVGVKLLDRQFMLDAHVVTSLVTVTLPLRTVVTTPVGLTISRS